MNLITFHKPDIREARIKLLEIIGPDCLALVNSGKSSCATRLLTHQDVSISLLHSDLRTFLHTSIQWAKRNDSLPISWSTCDAALRCITILFPSPSNLYWKFLNRFNIVNQLIVPINLFSLFLFLPPVFYSNWNNFAFKNFAIKIYRFWNLWIYLNRILIRGPIHSQCP